jgi:hypothetical protein
VAVLLKYHLETFVRHVYESDVLEELEFARRAGAKFSADPRMWSYSDEEIQPGILIALRWGLGDDCVLVMRLHDYFTPTIYAQMARATPKTQQPENES